MVIHTPKVNPRVVLMTEFGPVGPRLERGEPMPEYRKSYGLDEVADYTEHAEKMNRYIARNAETKKRK